MSVIEEIEHPFWTRIVRIEGYEGWFSLLDDEMSDGTPVRIRVEFGDPNDEIVQRNFSAIRGRWTEIWPCIQSRTHEMKVAYGYHEFPIRTESDWFELKPPTELIETNAEWSVMLQAEEAGWLLDFKGWEDAGGQGVF
jgi:hypothetical protein